MVENALAGIRVLDLGWGIAAPYCAKMLADYGAEVIKVEPLQGDPVRLYGPFPDDDPHPEKSGLFFHLNTNKLGVTLDLEHDGAGVAVLRKLVNRADAVIENWTPGFLASLGLPYQELQRTNPRLVQTSVTPFGQWGPYRDWQATEMVVFAMSSRMYGHGQPDREPLRYAPDVISFQAGASAAAATIAALWGAEAHGKGQWIDLSILEALAGNVDCRITVASYAGAAVGREWRAGDYLRGAYPCKDGFILFGSGADRYFRRLCRAMGRPDLLEDPRWFTPEARPGHKDEFDAELLPWLLEKTRDEIFHLCEAERVMCAPVVTIDEVYKDPQLVFRSYFQDVAHPAVGEVKLPGAPFIMTESPWAIRRPAPLLGEHNHQVYGDLLGYTSTDLARMHAAGVI